MEIPKIYSFYDNCLISVKLQETQLTGKLFIKVICTVISVQENQPRTTSYTKHCNKVQIDPRDSILKTRKK